MLVEVYQLSDTQTQTLKELADIESQLTDLRQHFFDVAEYGAKLINSALSLAKLSPFYDRTIRYYFNIFEEV